jgi:glycosyltransferase involved in cell wall biosynthesis
VSQDIRDTVKDNYTEGKEYFLFIGPVYPKENLVNLLKAFSIFKRRQRSNMKFLLLARSEKKHDSPIQNLKAYKYRDDVAILRNLSDEELVKIIGSAYALVYSSLQGFDVPLLEAMKCQVPAITFQSSPDEIAKDAVLYADNESIEDLADKMMLIYKNENLRKELIEKAKTIASQYSWDRTAEMLWRAILKTVD